MVIANRIVISLTMLGVLASAVWGLDPRSDNQDGIRALHGEWIYVEDRTEGRPVEQHQPSMSAKIGRPARFEFKREDGGVVVDPRIELSVVAQGAASSRSCAIGPMGGGDAILGRSYHVWAGWLQNAGGGVRDRRGG